MIGAHLRAKKVIYSLFAYVWWPKLLGSRAIAKYAHQPQANGQTNCMKCTIGQILTENILDEDHKHWPNYVAVTEMAIDSTFNFSIDKALFEALYGCKGLDGLFQGGKARRNWG